jgi:protein-disulfide isomerase
MSDSATGAQGRPVAWLATVALSALVVGAASWFAFLQYAILGHWCRFCLATHSGAVVASACLFRRAFRNGTRGDALNRKDGRSPGIRLGLGLGLLGLIILVAGQVLVKKRLYGVAAIAVQTGQATRQLVLFNGRFALSPDELPLAGSNSAPRFVVFLFDYTCVHCRRLHPLLREAAAHFKGQVAIIALPAPLEADCNPLIPETQLANFGACDYARLGLAVWHARPSAFREFDDWLFESDTQPSPDQARAKAEALVGKDALGDALSGSWVKDQLKLDVQLYIASSTAMHNARLPQLIFADAVAYGNIEDAEALEHLIESHRAFARAGP